MKKRIKANLAIAAFLTVCLLPSLGMVLLPDSGPAANQILAPEPRLFEEDGSFNSDVLEETTDYVADHLAFRQELITLDAALSAAVFQTSMEEQVLLGKEDWLYYRVTLEDYLRTEPLSDRQLYGAARSLALLREYALSRGGELYFTVAPNKVSLYPQFLPLVGEPLEGQDDIDRLVPFLAEEGVPYIDLFTTFRQEEEILYYKQDSHWNTLGAALAHDAILAVIGKEERFFDGRRKSGEGHLGDLYEMLYPAGQSLEKEEVLVRPFTFSYVRQPRSAEDQRIETENPAQEGRLLMFRDSFGNALYSFLAESYGSALFSRAMPYTISLLDETGADTVLIEIVERNLDWLATEAPVMPAPRRSLIGTPSRGEAAAAFTIVEDKALEGYLRLEGRLVGPLDPSSPIYLRLGQELYEASPVGDWALEGVPFVLYIKETQLSGEASVLYVHDGALYTSEPIFYEGRTEKR